MRIVLDTSGWIEVLSNTERARNFEPALSEGREVHVPSICLYEAAKFLYTNCGEKEVQAAVKFILAFIVIPLDVSIALAAARMSKTYRLPMADAIIYSTARMLDAELWTQDAHFRSLPHVKYFPKP